MSEYISGSDLINIPMDDKKNIKKALGIIGNSMVLIGILGVIGTAGGLDQNRIELIPGFAQMGFFLILCFAGIILSKIKKHVRNVDSRTCKLQKYSSVIVTQKNQFVKG